MRVVGSSTRTSSQYTESIIMLINENFWVSIKVSKTLDELHKFHKFYNLRISHSKVCSGKLVACGF